MTKYIINIIYNMFLIIGYVYLVTYKGWNPWWILLVLALMVDLKDRNTEHSKQDETIGK